MYKLISKKYFIENISYIGYGIATIDETVRIEDINTEKGESEIVEWIESLSANNGDDKTLVAAVINRK